jgi:hypothetical protein
MRDVRSHSDVLAVHCASIELIGEKSDGHTVLII